MNRSVHDNRAGFGGQDMGEQFRVIAEIAGDIAFSVDCASGLPRYISAAVEQLLGYAPSDVEAHMRGQREIPALAALCAGLPERLRRFGLGDRTRLRLVREFEVRHADGHLVPVEVVSTLLLDAGGAALALVGVVRDLSAQRAREAEQKRFGSMLNHEFRTPLSTIDGAIQRLEATQRDADEPTRQRYRKIAVAVEGDDLPTTMRCDPAGLRLAFKVLLDNAIQYSPADTAITLSGRCAAGGIELIVSDEGEGVSEEDGGRIFDKFYRGSNAAGLPGSGLGLYMARSIVEVHGGTLELLRRRQGGTQFRAWLPAQGAAGKNVASADASSDNQTTNTK
jgi:PAS domain S-box-containing protein